MENHQITMLDILIGTHLGLPRQGPGNAAITFKALSFLENADKISRTADLGCGTGGQTMVLAQNIPGKITGIDQSADFIDVFNANAKELSLQERVSGIVGRMEDLPFAKEELDLIWSEGAIDSICFEEGLTHWHGFLKKGGYVAVTCPSWLTCEHPAEVERFWADAGSSLDNIGHNIEVMQEIGFRPIAAFTLPETCWTDDYFTPRGAAERSFLGKYPGNRVVEEYIKSSQYEVALYEKYKQRYGYVFYIGAKL